MIGSKNSKVTTMINIVDNELSGAIDNINEGRNEDARAKIEYAKKVISKITKIDSDLKKSINKQLKEFNDHIKKFSAS